MRIVKLLSCACVLAALAADASAEPTSCQATLDGHVVDAGNHDPVAGATVLVDGQVAAITDGNGRFHLTALCPGQLTVAVEREDYTIGTRQLLVESHASLELELVTKGETIEIHDKPPDPTELRSTTVLGREALDRRRGQGLAAQVAEVPGVSELQSASGMAKPIIRGQFGRRLILLVDGVRHRAQEWGLDHAPEIDPFIADEIGIVRGAGGVRYGPDAIGGVLLVEPPELRHDPGVQGELHLVGSSNGRGGAIAGRVNQAFADVPGLALLTEGSAKRLAASSTPDYALDNTGVAEWGAGLTVGYERDALETKLSYRHFQQRLGVCSCLQIDNVDDFFAQLDRKQPLGVENYDADFEIERPSQTVGHDLVVARVRNVRDALGAFTLTYAFQHDLRREYDVVRQATTGAQFNFRLVTHEAELVFQHNPLHLSDHWHVRGFAGVTGVVQNHWYSGLTLVPDHDSVGGGIYAAERLIGHETELELGVRFDVLARSASLESRDYARLVRSGQIADAECASRGDTRRCDSRYYTPTASGGVLHRWTDALSTKLELSTSSRAPNPDEQYLNGTSPTFPVLGLGKPDLDPETTYSSSATVAYTSDYLTAEASAFANYIDDYIYFAPAVDEMGNPIFDVLIRGTFPRFTTQPIDAVFYGADGGVIAKPHPMLELGAQFSMVRAANADDGSYLVFVPPDRYRGQVTFRPRPQDYITLGGTYVTRQKRFDLRADFDDPPGAYVLLGAELGTEVALGSQQLKLALQGQNLTNTRYRDYTSLVRYFADEPGLQVWLRASVYFDGDH